MFCIYHAKYGKNRCFNATSRIQVEIIDTPPQYLKEKELFEKAVNIGTLNKNINNQEKFFYLMDELIKKYPQGIYREYCLNMEIIVASRYPLRIRGKKAAEIIINEYPETKYAFPAINALSLYYIENNTIKEGIEYLNELKKKTTNLEIKNECDRQLKELMKEDEK